MKIELGKKYRTRDGQEVVLLAVDAPGPYPVIGYTVDSAYTSTARSWASDGYYIDRSDASPNDLIEVKPPIVFYVNLYDNYVGQNTFKHEVAAKNMIALDEKIAILKVTYDDGEVTTEVLPVQ